MRILVTGSARAIGRSTAEVLASRGHHVIATARDVSMLDDLAVAQRLALDVTDAKSIAAALSNAGEIDAIVNNAALDGSGPMESFSLDRLRAMFETNTIGAVAVVQQVAEQWRTRGSGVIVNVSSVQGQVASPLGGAYSATKYALEALSETLHYELGHFGIRVVIVEPGYIAPGMKQSYQEPGPSAYDALREQWDGIDSKMVGPGGRPGPELVGNAIADAIENPDTPLRVRVGADAELILGVRKQLDDADFESTMRATIGLTW